MVFYCAKLYEAKKQASRQSSDPLLLSFLGLGIRASALSFLTARSAVLAPAANQNFFVLQPGRNGRRPCGVDQTAVRMVLTQLAQTAFSHFPFLERREWELCDSPSCLPILVQSELLVGR